jgi:uncharacterized protein YhbP (UPF0306 family)
MLEADVIKIAKDFINENPLGTIGSVNANGEPWGASVYFGCDANKFVLYFSTKDETKKHQNIQENPNVSVVFVNEEIQMTIQAQGVAEVVNTIEDATAAAEAFNATTRNTDDWKLPLEKMQAGGYELYKVTVKYARLTGFGDHREGEMPEKIEFNVR